MAESRVVYDFGYGTRPQFVRVPGGPYIAAVHSAYRGPGGVLWVGYMKRHVAEVGTTSPRYRTKTGLGVGTRIPLGPCHTVGNDCVYRWNGFRYWEEPCCGWNRSFRYGTRKVDVWLWTQRGTVAAVQITDSRFR